MGIHSSDGVGGGSSCGLGWTHPPTWARLPSRAASVGVWVLSVVLFIIGGALMPVDSTPEQTELMPDSTPEQTEQSAALGSHLLAT